VVPGARSLRRPAAAQRRLAAAGGAARRPAWTGRTAIARTPTGDFRVTRKIPGWRQSYLGELYYPVYFTGPYAVHGSRTVPPRPVSHGCVRIPMWFARDYYDRHPIGRPVIVR
jgi:lipoprotein-anchoring transpeptidase ErfK/SrfK